jgi:hypothetical protein
MAPVCGEGRKGSPPDRRLGDLSVGDRSICSRLGQVPVRRRKARRRSLGWRLRDAGIAGLAPLVAGLRMPLDTGTDGNRRR